MISSAIFFIFEKEKKNVNITILTFFIGPLQQIFLCMGGFDGFLWMTYKDFCLQQLSILPITSFLFMLKVMSNIFLLFCYLSQERTLRNCSWDIEILEF